jgi:hypothetical protein
VIFFPSSKVTLLGGDEQLVPRRRLFLTFRANVSAQSRSSFWGESRRCGLVAGCQEKAGAGGIPAGLSFASTGQRQSRCWTSDGFFQSVGLEAPPAAAFASPAVANERVAFASLPQAALAYTQSREG